MVPGRLLQRGLRRSNGVTLPAFSLQRGSPVIPLGGLHWRDLADPRHVTRRHLCSSSADNAGAGLGLGFPGGEEESEEGGESREREVRIRVARVVQEFVRAGFSTLEPEPFVEAARSINQLPSGSVARRYLSGFIMNGHGNLLVAKGDVDQASELLQGAFEHAMEEAAQGLGDDRYSDIVSFANDLAVNQAQSGDLLQAEKLMKRALYWVGSSRLAPDRVLMAATYCNLGLIQRMSGNSSSALDNHERSVEHDRKEDAIVSCIASLNLSATFREEGITEKGEKLAKESLARARTLVEEYKSQSQLAIQAQTQALLGASLINLALFKVIHAETLADIREAHDLAQEAKKVGHTASEFPALFLLGLTAPTRDHAKRAYNQVLEHPKCSQDISVAVRENLAVVGETATDESVAKEERTSLRRRSMSQGLMMVGLVGTDRFLWVQEQFIHISGLTLKKFIAEGNRV